MREVALALATDRLEGSPDHLDPMKRSQLVELNRRTSSALHYHTFPVRPPVSRGRPPSSSPTTARARSSSSSSQDGQNGAAPHHESPLPTKQLAVLAFIALAEQTALNSISPYLPEMASTFPTVDVDEVGLYVGIIASSFALAQFATNFFWGWLSDHIGRKPVVLCGTLLTAACFMAFGFCRTLWQAILVQALMGLVNGNQAVISTCLGELTDRSNQSRAFVYLPVVYGLGSITGPIVGGLLVSQGTEKNPSRSKHPFLAPNLFSAAVLIIDLIVAMIYLDETMEEAKNLPPLGQRFKSLFAWMWHSSRKDQSDTFNRSDGNGDPENGEGLNRPSGLAMPTIFPEQATELKRAQVVNRDTILILSSFLTFQLCNISYNSLYPIFASAPEPTGRDLSPRFIGLSLGFAGVIAILFQVGIFGRLRDTLGNRGSYRMSFAGFTIAFILMPLVGYKGIAGNIAFGNGMTWVWIEVGFILLVKTIAAVGGLTSALLLVCLLTFVQSFTAQGRLCVRASCMVTADQHSLRTDYEFSPKP